MFEWAGVAAVFAFVIWLFAELAWLADSQERYIRLQIAGEYLERVVLRSRWSSDPKLYRRIARDIARLSVLPGSKYNAHYKTGNKELGQRITELRVQLEQLERSGVMASPALREIDERSEVRARYFKALEQAKSDYEREMKVLGEGSSKT